VEPNRCDPIGLEIAAERVNMVQFETVGGRQTIRAAISLPYADGREALFAEPGRLKTLLARAFAERPFRGRKVVSCLPAADVNIITLSYQRAAGEDDNAAIVRDLRERLKGELEQTVVDYVTIRSDSADAAERNAIVAAAPRERVLRYLGALRDAGLEPVALDIGPAALVRLVSALDVQRSFPNALLVNFGQAKSYLTVIWGRRLMLDREFEFGESLLAARVGKTLDMSPAEALKLLRERGFADGGDSVTQTICEVLRPEFAAFTAEVNKTLIYTASKTRGQSVERVYLLGSVARYPGVAHLVQRLVDMPADVVNLLNVFPARPGAATPGDLEPVAGLGVATGLALRSGDADG
jgi:type IV pilus assembly protein PilM